jgi:hypothetical protein
MLFTARRLSKLFPEDTHRNRTPPGASPKLGAFAAQIGPLDRFARWRGSRLTLSQWKNV